MSTNKFDAFISYARSTSTKLASDLQLGLERFAKPWNRMRAIRVFRDDASMSANTALWSTIEKALQDAEWFVLLATPESAQSEYVNAEVQWWVQHKGPGRLLIVHAGGVVSWDRRTGDFSVESAVPQALRRVFPEEPRWVDLSWFSNQQSLQHSDPRFIDRVADISSAVRGIERDVLIGENVRQHRKIRLLTRASIAALSILLVLALAAGTLAVIQRGEAVAQRNAATAQALVARVGQLASTALSTAPTDLPKALALATTAYRSQPNRTAASALHDVLATTPQLVDIITLPDPVVALAVTPDGTTVATVTVTANDKGKVVVLNRRTGESTEIFETDIAGHGAQVWISDDAKVVASGGKIWHDGAITEQDVRALSPSGRTIAWTEGGVGDSRLVVGTQDGRAVSIPTRVASSGENHWLRLINDEEVVAVTMSGWVVRASTNGANIREFQVPVQAWMLGWGTISADGSRFGYPTESGNLEVLDITGTSEPADLEAPLSIRTGGSRTEVFAFNSHGTRAAVPADGHITVGEVRPRGTTVLLADLLGSGPSEGVIAYPSDDLVVSATGTQVLVWDLRARTPLGRATDVEFGTTCNACGPPKVSVSPNGNRAIIAGGQRFAGLASFGGRLALVDLTGGKPIELPHAYDQSRGDIALWLDNDTALIDGPNDDPELLAVRGADLGEVVQRISLPVALGAEPHAALQSHGSVVIAATDQLLTVHPDSGDYSVSQHPATTVTGNGAYALNIQWDGDTMSTTVDIIDAYENRKTGSVRIDGSVINVGVHDGDEIFLIRTRDLGADLLAVPTEGAQNSREIAHLDARIRVPGQVVAHQDTLYTERSGAIMAYDLRSGAGQPVVPVTSAAGDWNGVGVSPDGTHLVIANEPLQQVLDVSIDPNGWERTACTVLGEPVSRAAIESVLDSTDGITLGCS